MIVTVGDENVASAIHTHTDGWVERKLGEGELNDWFVERKRWIERVG